MNRKLALRYLIRISDLLSEYSGKADADWRKENFNTGVYLIREIIGYVEADNYEEAKQKWRVFEQYQSDCLPISEELLEEFAPLRQKVINFGLQ